MSIISCFWNDTFESHCEKEALRILGRISLEVYMPAFSAKPHVLSSSAEVIAYVSEQHRFWPDCTNVQSGLNLYCLRVLYGLFPHDEAIFFSTPAVVASSHMLLSCKISRLFLSGLVGVCRMEVNWWSRLFNSFCFMFSIGISGFWEGLKKKYLDGI